VIRSERGRDKDLKPAVKAGTGDMGSDFPIFEIIIFGMIAAFLVLRLRNTLGRRTGFEQEDPADRPNQRDRADASSQGDDNVIPLPGRQAPPDREPEIDLENATPLDRALAEIGAADRSFDRHGFADGARSAYEMIVTSFAQGDKKALKPLLASKVYKSFCDVIDQRKTAGQTQETQLVGFDSAEIVEAAMEGRQAEVTVKFVAEMISVTRDADGNVIAGNVDDVTRVTDIWTFAKDTRSRNPNWELITTRTAH